MLMGPAGFYEMTEGVIRAMRHVHMGPDDAAYYGVKAGDMMRLKIGGPAGSRSTTCSSVSNPVRGWKCTSTPTKATRAACSRIRRWS